MAKSKTKKMRKQAGELADRIAPHVEAARDKAGPVLAEAREKAGPVLTEAREKAAPYVKEAREKAAPYVKDARQKAGPVIADARGKAAPVVAEAQDWFSSEVLPTLSAALAAVDEATEDVREEARKRGLAATAALKGELEPPKKSHKLRNLLLMIGLGGLVAAVAKKLSARQPETAWQSSYTPPPAPAAPAPVDETPTATAAAAAAAGHSGDDEAAAAPGEAAADAGEEPHPATTPDNPAEEIDLKKD
jgi:vacuolar-type H+-ATPase subunit H